MSGRIRKKQKIAGRTLARVKADRTEVVVRSQEGEPMDGCGMTGTGVWGDKCWAPRDWTGCRHAMTRGEWREEVVATEFVGDGWG